MATFLNLKTSDGAIVRVESEVLKSVSSMVKDMVQHCEDLGIEEDEDGGMHGNTNDEPPIYLNNVNKRTLDHIIEWAKEHQHDERPAPVTNTNPERRAEEMTDWDRKFVDKLSRHELFDILLAANFLDIKELLDLGCKKTILMIHNKSVDEMRDILGVEDDLTPEQKEQIRKENEWCEER